ncbi:S-layer homology domain-containing protein [Paenibacillus cymbidii]|uniref:S-layer homology domain-containing protein n=1 Tax=Paenibacillus cymbidii TaxID=1639034 RepID=UPI001F3F8FB4|nr:S-layer homology domain-containing protein [Paenibacillus cymbidii]
MKYPPIPKYTVSASAATVTPGVGADDAITLKVWDSKGGTDKMFSGAHDVTVSGYAQAPDGSYGSFNGTALTAGSSTISVTFANGVATPNLRLNKAAAQTIGFSVADVETPATNTVSITPSAGSAASMALTTDITAPASNGSGFLQQPVVTLLDAYGNTSTGDSSTVVTVSKKDTGVWTLTGTLTATASAGVATFTGLGATNEVEVTGAQLAFDAAGLTQITSTTVTLPSPAPAQTASASAATTTPGVGVNVVTTLTVKNALGNTDTTFSGAHNVTVSGYAQAPDNSYGSFNGTDLTAGPNTISVTFANGVATPNLKLNKAAAQTIGFSVADVATPATNTVSITPSAGSAASMALTTDITAPASNGGGFLQQPVVTLLDAYGNTSTGDSSTVVTVSKKDAGTWVLSGTVSATASAGVATFTGLGATNAAEVTGAQLAFDAAGLTQIASTTVTLPAPAPAQTVSASAAATTPETGEEDAITLTVKNALGNTDTTFSGAHNVTVSGYAQAPDNSYGSFNGTALTAGPNTISVTFVSGVATPNLKLNKAATSQTIGFSVTGVATPATNTVSITPTVGNTASMALTTDITAPVSNGGAFVQQPVVTLLDAYGNTSTGDSSTVVTVSKKDTGTWTLTGTATATASAGVATFTGLGATNTAEVTGAQLAFDAAGLTQIASTTVTLPAPAPAQTVSASAAAATPGVGVDDAITLTVKNALGNTDTTFSGAHNVTVSGYAQAPDNSYGSFNGTALTAGPNTISVTFVSGVATPNLKLNKAATSQTIGFSVTGVATPATNTVSITPTVGNTASMALTTDITAPASNGGTFAQQPVVTLLDAYGNTSTGDSSTVVTVSKKDAGTWTLTGTATATASVGVATFTGLGATNEAEVTGAQLAFDAAGLTQIASMTVTLPAPAPAQTVSASAAATTPETGEDDAITLTVKNALGNTDTTFSGAHDVTISGYAQAPDNSYGSFNGAALTAGPNTISVTFTNGMATPNLQLNKAETSQTIGFSVADVATPATNMLSITPIVGAAASMKLTTDITAPASNGGVFAQQPVVTLLDAYGNTSTGDSSTVVTVSKKDAGAWTLTGTATATASAGVATFTGLGATNSAEVTGAQLAFDAAGLAQIASRSVTLPWPIPGAPILAPATLGDSRISLTWDPVIGSTGYQIFKSTTSGAYGLEEASVSGSVYSYEATGLANGTMYYFVIKATNPAGDSAASNEVSTTPRTVPAAPADVTAAAGNGQAIVSFTAPANGGSAITSYEVTAMPGNHTVTGTGSPITVTGLSNGTTYTFTVKAFNSAGGSTASGTSNPVTPSAPFVNSSSSSTPTSSSTPVPQPEPPLQPEPASQPEPALEQPMTDVFSSIIDFAAFIQRIEAKVAEAKKANKQIDFVDIQGHWAEQTADIFTKLRIIEGYADGTFKPDASITRAEFAVILNRVFEIQGGNSSGVVLNDIGGNWAKDAIQNLVAVGIIYGYEDGTFRPDNTITREEMVVMISRILNINNVPKDTAQGKFTDLNDSYAANEIRAAAQAGVLSGKGNGIFDPKGNATRREALQIILNMLELDPQLKTLLESLG